MTQFRTTFSIKPLNKKLSYSDAILMMGSCFTQNIGNKLKNLLFDILVNPYGILYNPLSLENAISEIIDNKIYTQNDLIFFNSKYHSLNHHGDFSNTDLETCLIDINSTINKSNIFFEKTRYVFLTLGTSTVYFDITNDKAVGNCHKMPSDKFYSKRLTLEETTNSLENIVNMLKENMDDPIICFTVSPIRHFRDGAIENKLSKATLLLAIDLIIQNHPDIYYFPAYEIVNDDLRDYRFYADDMQHPNNLALNYIWELFKNNCINDSCFEAMIAIDKLITAMNHKVTDTNTEEYIKYLNYIKTKQNEIEELYPFVPKKFW
ncbi:MAG: GSCFA domain-containing protein [Bacteroidales bacterium]|jgi:hypothetical protein